jgi:hypothetical protein
LSYSPEVQAEVLRLIGQERGAVLAIPHAGHFLAAALGLIELSTGRKPISVMFDEPSKNVANESFWSLFLQRGPGVRPLPASSAGLLAAVKSLRRGEIVVVFADIVSDVFSAQSVPWFDRPRTVMPGAAWLALSGRASLKVAVPFTDDRGSDVRLSENLNVADQTVTGHATYLLNLRLWAVLERLMAPEGPSAARADSLGVFRDVSLSAILDAIRGPDELRTTLAHLFQDWPGLLREDGLVLKLIKGKTASSV